LVWIFGIDSDFVNIGQIFSYAYYTLLWGVGNLRFILTLPPPQVRRD